MAGYTKWVSKQKGNPLWLGVAVVGFTVTFWFGYKGAYVPWVERARMRRAEEVANFLIMKEEEQKELT